MRTTIRIATAQSAGSTRGATGGIFWNKEKIIAHPQIALNSQWQAPGDKRVFIVTEKKPFGRMTIKQADHHYYGETTKAQFLQTFKPYAGETT